MLTATCHALPATGLAGLRVGVATAQSAQNVVCFGLIPDLFPSARSTGGCWPEFALSHTLVQFTYHFMDLLT